MVAVAIGDAWRVCSVQGVDVSEKEGRSSEAG